MKLKNISKLRLAFYSLVFSVCLISIYHDVKVYVNCDGEVFRGMFKLVCVEAEK